MGLGKDTFYHDSGWHLLEALLLLPQVRMHPKSWHGLRASNTDLCQSLHWFPQLNLNISDHLKSYQHVSRFFWQVSSNSSGTTH